MLWLLQMLIAIAVAWANIYFQITSNWYLVAAWAVCAAYGLTVIPVQIFDWWQARHIRREIYTERARQGLPSGWRRHLPGAYPRARRRAQAMQECGDNSRTFRRSGSP